MANHQNNFASNLTSNQIAGVTTTPLNSIPSIAAPFYIALDATNLNGKYEVVSVTGKTATHINHAATTYAHTTAEEVRMVVPAEELDSFVTNAGTAGVFSMNAPQGFLINGKISVADTGSGMSVTLLTLAGTAPSATDPVYCRIGDTVRTISAALTFTVGDGANYLNLGSAELATKEVDLFVYLFWKAGDSSIVLGASRIPSAALYSDFSSDTANEKGLLSSAVPGATDVCEVIGRFACTMSAGAGYTWSVPTYTAKNLIQRPIYETRWLTWTPAFGGSGSMTYTSTSVDWARYQVNGKNVNISYCANGTTGGTANISISVTLPFTASSAYSGQNQSLTGTPYDAGWKSGYTNIGVSTNSAVNYKYDTSNWALAAAKYVKSTGSYEI